MKISRWLVSSLFLLALCIPACARKSSSGVSVEGPKNKYEVKLEKSEKD